MLAVLCVQELSAARSMDKADCIPGTERGREQKSHPGPKTAAPTS